jgi:hypothetical protein
MTTLNIRNIDDKAVARAKQAAAARGLTLGQYVAALVALHDAARARADAGDDGLQSELTALGLQTITG